MSVLFRSADQLADAIVQKLGADIVLGLPVGIGKSIRIADALFRRAAQDRSISLKIFTGLTLEVPQSRGEFESRFLDPLVSRLYGDWPTPQYARAVRGGDLPPNIEVREFYLRPGAFLSNPLMQQSYTSINYSQVTRELLDLGVNVIAQLVSQRGANPDHYSLSCNPEITLDLLPFLRPTGEDANALLVGEVHPELPYMLGEAELPRAQFDLVLDDPDDDYPLFVLPNRQVLPADYATAMHVVSLIPDGGTIQLGIGSLSDAVAHCLMLRHRMPQEFARILQLLPGGPATDRRADLPLEVDPFERGLYASSELLSDALFALFEAGIVKRAADAEDPTVMQAGFFVGSGTLYGALRSLPEHQRKLIRMTRISEVNTLFGDEDRKRAQRTGARFINETMMATLLGAAVSDALEDGRVVSGVGGQFDFVSMAHALDDAQSILMLRARRDRHGKPQSNIRWRYGHSTVPRHCRDVYVSEYGIAETRGRSDQEVIAAMLNIADSAFQPELIAAAQRARKLSAQFRLPSDAKSNEPRVLKTIFDRDDVRPYFSAYPLGSELSAEERDLANALPWLATRVAHPLRNAGALLNAMIDADPDPHRSALKRMGLEKPASFRERLYRRLLAHSLKQTKGSR